MLVSSARIQELVAVSFQQKWPSHSKVAVSFHLSEMFPTWRRCIMSFDAAPPWRCVRFQQPHSTSHRRHVCSSQSSQRRRRPPQPTFPDLTETPRVERYFWRFFGAPPRPPPPLPLPPPRGGRSPPGGVVVVVAKKTKCPTCIGATPRSVGHLVFLPRLQQIRAPNGGILQREKLKSD